MKKLVIVESPGKIKTIKSFLSSEYTVMASIGHIRLLDKVGKYKLGIDLKDKFKPSYINDPKKKDVIKKLRAAAKAADVVMLGMDADNEGESIAWHLKETLKIPKKKLKRIVFNEITKTAVLKAIANPGVIDMDVVDAAETRRLIDRIAGFRLSGLALSKLSSKSAGRVQSAALKVLVDKELLIKAFVPKVYYEIFLPFDKGKKEFKAQYRGTDKKVQLTIKTKKTADTVVSECVKGNYKVTKIDTKDRKVKAKPPYTTSTFQQEVSSKLGYGAKKAMKTAQKLYEGFNIEGTHYGLITYMRTDSDRLSSEFIAEAKKVIIKDHGKTYYSGTVNSSKKTGNVQNAHTGITPTHLELTPAKVKPFLGAQEFKVYKLIYNRAVAALMTDAKVQDTKVVIGNGKYRFGLSGKKIIFDGFYKVYTEFTEDDEKNTILPAFKVGEKIKDKALILDKKETKPPRRYSEAGLVKKLESLGIGRPSTYASIMDTLTKRNYSTREGKNLVATDQGIELIQFLELFFAESVINVSYTTGMEVILDQIAAGKAVKLDELQKFFDEFNPIVLKANREFKRVSTAVQTEEVCPKCGTGHLVIRTGRYGKMYGCSRFPHCRFTQKILTDEEQKKKDEYDKQLITAPICPECNKGKIVQKIARKGKNAGSVFYACTEFKSGCKNTYNEDEYKIEFKKE